MERPEPRARAKGHPSRGRIEGTTVAGGARSRARFARLLGAIALERQGFAVSSVAWVADHVEVAVEQPDGRTVVFAIERADQGRPSYLALARASLYYRGEGLDPRLDATVRAVAPRALARATVEDLAALIASDPDAGRATEPVPETPAESQRAFDEQALLSTWASPEVWSSFFAVAEVARSQLDSLDFFDRCTFVQHCDQECLCVNPQLGVPAVPVVLYPWDDRVRALDWPAGASAAREEQRARGPGMVTTDLDERDVILGRGLDKLVAALDHLATVDELGDMVFCSSTCVPVVAGEDMESVVNAKRGALPVPVLYLTTTPQSMQGVFRDILVDRRLAAEARGLTVEPRAINLIGFPREPALDELEELLGQLGVKVNAAILPALSPDLIETLPRAALDVVHPNELWRGHVDQLRFDSPRPAIAPPAPFGLRGTRAWLEAVTSALGIEADLAPLDAALAANADAWDSGRRAASALTLGFVLRASDARHLVDPAQTWGVPLLAATEEMGFRAEVFLAAAEADDAAKRAAASIREVRRDPETVEVVIVRDRDELRRRLESSAASALYSEHFNDRRVTESGRATFNCQYFERGLRGALATQRRLLELCELPFYRRYGRHLREAARRADMPPAFGRMTRPDDKGAGS